MYAVSRSLRVLWTLYDVGGMRSQRHAWISYFDAGMLRLLTRRVTSLSLTLNAVDAIIFLAPLSAFDQALPEDPTVNRLEDSLILWKAICSSKLIAEISIILFLNKVDLLQAKLNSGVQLSRYVTSYGDRPNDYASVSKCTLLPGCCLWT